jgi:hypothetical protein
MLIIIIIIIIVIIELMKNLKRERERERKSEWEWEWEWEWVEAVLCSYSFHVCILSRLDYIPYIYYNIESIEYYK